MSVEWQKLFSLEVKRAYSISNGGEVWIVFVSDCCRCQTINNIECYCYCYNIFKKQFDKLVLLAYSTDMTGNSVHKTKLKGEENGNDG